METGTVRAPERSRGFGVVTETRKRAPAGKAADKRSGAPLTAVAVAALKAGEWASDPSARGAGRLQARRLKDTLAWYYRYTDPNGERIRLPIGTDLSLAEARRIAGELSRRYQSGERDLRGAIEAEARETTRQRQHEVEAEAAIKARNAATLGALLAAYVAQLARDGKSSAPRVERALQRHVREAWPKLWATPAADVTPDDLLSVIARLVDDGSLREAAKLRSYLSAAYNAAIRARQDARALADLRDLKITTNPARDLVTIEGSSATRDRALSIAELRAYWRRICELPDPDGALLRFHLLTGGQRAQQLSRLGLSDIDRDTATMRLMDGKGRRRRPRMHLVPLIPAALDALKAMAGGEHGENAFTVTGGMQGAAYHVVQHRVRVVSEAMVEAGESAAPFSPGDLRRTIETRLAAEGVSTEVRAQLQSHGLGGVQARHYDRHGYEVEKREALEVLYRLVSAPAATVTPIKRAKARSSPGRTR